MYIIIVINFNEIIIIALLHTYLQGAENNQNINKYDIKYIIQEGRKLNKIAKILKDIYDT